MMVDVVVVVVIFGVFLFVLAGLFAKGRCLTFTFVRVLVRAQIDDTCVVRAGMHPITVTTPCITARGLDCLPRLTHAARHGHVFGNSTWRTFSLVGTDDIPSDTASPACVSTRPS